MTYAEHALMLGGMLGFGLLLWSFFRRPVRDPKIVDFSARRKRALKAAQQVISR